MRKIVAIILFFTYTGATAATVLNLHFCERHWMTTLGIIKVFSTNHSNSCHQEYGMKDCCRHPIVQVKINANQLPSNLFYKYNFHCISQTLPYLNVINRSLSCEVDQKLPSIYSPPHWLLSANSRQAFYKVFLI